MLTMRRFIDVAFAIFVAEYQRLGMDLLTAIEKVSGLGDPVDPNAPPPAEKVAEKNADAMQALMGMMGGVKGAPVR